MSNLKMLYVELGFYALNLLLFQLIRLNFFDYGAERLLFSFKVMLQITKKNSEHGIWKTLQIYGFKKH